MSRVSFFNLGDYIMTYEFNLSDEPYKKIKSGLKNVEMRLYDERRKDIKIGDYIILKNEDTNKKLKVKVLNINIFNSFKELYASYPKNRLGYSDNETASYKDMNRYYDDFKQKKYKVMAIEIELLEEIE